MRLQKLFLVLLLLIETCCLTAQTQKFLPVIAPPGPEAAAFTKYGNYEVNLFTGIPEISIPLYEIKIGELGVPVSLNYHASGIKVNDIASRAGLGWDLQAGGSITRKIIGHADELSGNYLSATPTSENRVKSNAEINPLTEAGLEYLNNVDQGTYDVEPDIFSYSFPGHSGKFLFNQKNNFAPVLIPYAPVSISSSATPNHLSLGMTDESGIVYRFDSTEWSSTGGGISVSCTSAWLLSDMISANKQDSVHFRYITRTGSGITDSYISDYLVLEDNCTGSYVANQTGKFGSDQGSVSTWWQQLTEIDFKNGKVVFEGAPESRLDFSSQFKLQNRLNAIKIYSYDPVNNVYTLVRSIYFFHSYFINGTDGGTKRLKLDSLQIRTNSGSVAQTYKFNYNTTVALPSNISRMKDYWGYFNNVTNADLYGFPTSIPKTRFQYFSQANAPEWIYVGGNRLDARDPDPGYMQSYILQKITFPTGGFTQFEYETNQYLDPQNNPKYAGGLRIKSIKSYTGTAALPLVKTYKYGYNESGYGRNNFLLEDHFFMSAQDIRKKDDMQPAENGLFRCSGVANTKRTTTFFSNPTNEFESFDGAPVVYPFITEYIGDGTSNAGKTTYLFSDKTDLTQNAGYKSPILTSYHFVRGLLINKSDYRRNADNSYSVVSENRKKYQYFPFQTTTGSIGLTVFKTKITEDYRGLRYNTGCEFGTDSYSYLYFNYDVLTGDNKLVTDSVITYDQDDPSKYSSVSSSYTYDDVTHLQNNQMQTTNSKDQKLTSTYTYPYNYTTAPYTTMTSNHLYDKIIRETKTNGSPLSILTNNYSAFASNNFLTATIQLQVRSNPVETRAFFNQYDSRGNILEMQKSMDVKQSFIWDYQSLQPVAVVTNASQADIAYCSFESNGKGNWAFNGTPDIDPTAPTGDRIYKLLPAKPLTKPGLTSTGFYIISYWTKNTTAFLIAGTQPGYPITGRVVNEWHYFEHKITGQTTVTVSGTGAIDEVRLYPAANAQMTSYTYKPLIGMTSQCDANSHIIYYEYDGLGRLMLVRDQDNNIIKRLYYNYAGQIENAAIFYNNLQSVAFIKAGCTGCLAGTSVNYIVPAQMYSATTQVAADQLAVDDAVANGQTYANSNGSCTAPAAAPLTGTNAITQKHTMTFHNNCTGVSYDFSLEPVVTGILMGSVPAGNYNVTFNAPAGTGLYTYTINNSYMIHVNTGTISGVNFSSSGNTIRITP